MREVQGSNLIGDIAFFGDNIWHLNYQLLRVGTRPEKRAIDRIVMTSYDFRFDKIQHLNNDNVHVMYGQWQWALKKNLETILCYSGDLLQLS
jgi:hypothetical protein